MKKTKKMIQFNVEKRKPISFNQTKAFPNFNLPKKKWDKSEIIRRVLYNISPMSMKSTRGRFIVGHRTDVPEHFRA